MVVVCVQPSETGLHELKPWTKLLNTASLYGGSAVWGIHPSRCIQANHKQNDLYRTGVDDSADAFSYCESPDAHSMMPKYFVAGYFLGPERLPRILQSGAPFIGIGCFPNSSSSSSENKLPTVLSNHVWT